MEYCTFPPSEGVQERGDQRPEKLTHSLYEALQHIPDPRRGAGRRYRLAVVLCLICVAKLAGETTLKGITEWVRLRAQTFVAAFGLTRETMPCQMTYKRVLDRIDGQTLVEILSAFFTRWEAEERCGEEPSRLQTEAGHREHAQVAIDGKAVRSTSREAHRVHQLSAYDVTTGVVLFQVNVGEKQNEISALKPLLTSSFVHGRILTADAMHTQTEMCSTIHRFGGYYLLFAKDNQPTLATDLADFFSDPPWGWQRAEVQTWDKAHGRLEHRHLICTPELNDWCANRWAGVAQVFCLTRRSTLLKTGKTRQQTVYGISNLPLGLAPPARMLSLIRAHWLIENRLHWRRDVTLGEDQCQTRTGAAPSILACLNSGLLAIMDRLGVRNLARQFRFFEAHPDQALLALVSGSCSVY